MKQWYAIHTRYKCEKYVARFLIERGIEAYVPVLTKVRQYTRKIKTYELPLINCYAFVRIDEADRVEVLRAPHVVGYVEPGGQRVPIPEEEMQIMRRVVGEFEEVQMEPGRWIAGEEVEVISGGLTGLKGKVVARHGKNEFIVQLETLGYQLKMVMNEKLLSRLTTAQSAV